MLYRSAALLFAVMAAFHTFGGFWSTPNTAMQSCELAAMRSVRYPTMGPQRNYHDFYAGFGLLVSPYLSLCDALAWQLAHFVVAMPEVQRGWRRLCWPHTLAPPCSAGCTSSTAR